MRSSWPPDLPELDEDDFGVCAEAQGRAPGAGSPGGEHEHFAEAIESVDVGAVNSVSDPREWPKLAAVGVARKLKRDARSFGDVQRVRGMRKQDARASRVNGGALKDGWEARPIIRLSIVDADELQSINLDFFVVQHVDAGASHSVQIFSAVREFLVIAGDEIGSVRRR